MPRRGLMVLISDLLGTGQRAASHRPLRAGHDVMVLHVPHDDELDFPFNDPTRFEGLESDAQLTCNPQALRDGYLAALQRFLERVRHASAATQCDYLLIRTSDAPDAVLAKILNDRMRSVRR